MPGMKVTVDAAMRARDVSRPQPEHDAAAEAAIASMPALRGTPGTRVTPIPPPAGRTAEAPRPGPMGPPPPPRPRPGPPVPGPVNQPGAARAGQPSPPDPAVAPRPTLAPRAATAPNAGAGQPSEQREPGSREAKPPAGPPPADDHGTRGPARQGRRKRVRRRRSQS